MPIEFSIEKAAGFHFETAVCGHGWYDLAPFKYDPALNRLEYVFQDGKNVAAGYVEDRPKELRVWLANAKAKRSRIERDVRHILRLDDDMAQFYGSLSGRPELGWVPKLGAGRLLRSPTVFEDIVKTMCTTNCSWSLTKKMVENLVGKLGAPAKGGMKAFPTVTAMAAVDEKFFREEIKAGYRSPYFVELAQKIAAGELDPEALLHSELPTDELKKEIKKIKGFGDYAAENLLKLLGRYDGLALDSWLRARFYEKHNRKKVCADKKIAKHYHSFGEWQGLAMWCDMTEDWFAK